MLSPLKQTFVRWSLMLAAAALAAAWLFSAPAALTTGSLGVVTLIAAFAWIVQNAFTNGQPVPSLAQRLYDSEQEVETRARRRTK